MEGFQIPLLIPVGLFQTKLPQSLGHHKKNTILTAKMAIESRDEFKRILNKENIKLDLEEKGILHLCDNEISLIHGRKVNKWLNEAGLSRKEVSIDEMISIEPSLNLENFVGGFYTDSDMSGDIHKFTMLLAEACMNKGVTFYYETEIKKINHNKKQPIEPALFIYGAIFEKSLSKRIRCSGALIFIKSMTC